MEVIARIVMDSFDFFVEESAEKFPFQYTQQLQKELVPYLEAREAGPNLMAWIEQNKVTNNIKTVDYLVYLNQKISKTYTTMYVWSPAYKIARRRLLPKRFLSDRLDCWFKFYRHSGIAARFVSGYLVQQSPTSNHWMALSGPEADFTDLHAWAEAYVPGAGWIGLDPTSGLFK